MKQESKVGIAPYESKVSFAPYESLDFSNNYVFSEVLKSNPEICKEIIETILDVKVKEILQIDKEDVIKTSVDGHGVRLDVYVEGDEHIYDIEMQVRDESDLPKRSRYYQGILDTDFLRVGESYGKLKRTYVIFICKFDPFGEGYLKYTFSNRAKENHSIELNDESIKVFVYTRGEDPYASPKMKELMSYINRRLIDGELSEKIEDNLQLVLRDRGRRAKYMTFEWELARARRIAEEEGREEGRRAGREEGRLEALKTMLSKLTPEELLTFGFSPEDISKAQEM